jgi:hypothetical protein
MVGSVNYVRCMMVNFKGLAKREPTLCFPIRHTVYDGCNCVNVLLTATWARESQAKYVLYVPHLFPEPTAVVFEKFASVIPVCTDHSCCNLLFHL